jgi:hypothetical protein
MALYNIYVQDEQKEFLTTLFKFSFIIIIFHILMCLSNPSNRTFNFGMCGELFNDNFLSVFVYLLISISGYYLVGEEVLQFKSN